MQWSQKFNRRSVMQAAGAAALALSMGLASAPAQAAIDFSGETVTLIVPFKEGGGTDKWARFYAPRLAEQLPGKPAVVIKNMPGAGSTKGANHFSSGRVDADGLTLFASSGSTQFPFLLGDPRVKYDYADWNVVLASSTGGVAYLAADLGAKFAADPKSILNEQFIYGSQGATKLDLVPLLAFEMLGLKVEPVFGLKGRGDGRLMFERGEANIDYQTSSAYLSKVTPLVNDKKASPMMSWGALDENGNIVRDPTFPDMPTFKEVYTQVHGQEPSGDAWEAWKAFFIAGFPAQKMIFLPKGSSQEMIDTYSNAFKAATQTADFPEASKKRLGLYPQATGATADAFKKRGTEVDQAALDYVKGWLKDSYGVEL